MDVTFSDSPFINVKVVPVVFSGFFFLQSLLISLTIVSHKSISILSINQSINAHNLAVRAHIKLFPELNWK